MAKKLKKDFDRDKMYSKIMPTGTAEQDVAENDDIDDVPPSEPALSVEPTQVEYETPRFHNYMEDMLREKLPHTMKVLRCCQCDRCTLDILALTLNQLPSSYAVTDKDQTAERVKVLRSEYEVKVTATLIKAIQQVKAHPRHRDGGLPL